MNISNYIDRVDRAAARRFPRLMNLVSEPIVVISVFLFFFFDLILVLSWPLFFAAVWSRFHALQHHWSIRGLTVFILFGFAILFYRVRRDYRILYGVAETIVGLV